MSRQQQEFSEGDRVEYHPIGGGESYTTTTTGVITKVMTHQELFGETKRHIHADEEHPRLSCFDWLLMTGYVIMNDHTKKETPYKADNILRKLEE